MKSLSGLSLTAFGVLLVALALPRALRAGEESDLTLWANEGHWPRGSNAVEASPPRQFEKAQRLEAIGDVRQAAEHYRRLAEVYSEAEPYKDPAGKYRNYTEEALVLSAKNYLAAGNYSKCKDQLAEIRRKYAKPTYLDAIGQVQISLGRGFLEGKGEGGTYQLASRIRKARGIFDNLYKEDPEGRWADDALLGLGECDEAGLQYDDAIKRYKELLEKYPMSELRAEAEGRIAYCINRREPQPEYTESDTLEAQERIRHAKEEAEAGDLGLDLVALEENERVLLDRQARKRFDQAAFYVKNGRYRAAEVYYELIKARYPNSEWAKRAEEALVQLRAR